MAQLLTFAGEDPSSRPSTQTGGSHLPVTPASYSSFAHTHMQTHSPTHDLKWLNLKSILHLRKKNIFGFWRLACLT